MNIRPYKYHKQFRLQFFNYASSAYYFITICTHHHQRLFGRIKNGRIGLSAIGKIVEQCWLLIPAISSFAALDVFAVMPNHIHGIVLLKNPNEYRYLQKVEFKIRPCSLSTVIGGFKSTVTARVRRQNLIRKLWHSRYHDHIIRDEQELKAIRTYITNNPLRWKLDRKEFHD